MDAIRNILVPTDFSDFSSVALDYAISLSAQSNATIHLISVVEDDGIVTFRGPGANALREERKRAALTQMQEFLNRNADEYMYIRPVVCSGVPDREIARFARENHCDLIVIATHGRTGIAHMVMGSVAEKLVRHSTIPVLTVKPRVVVERMLANGEFEHQVI